MADVKINLEASHKDFVASLAAATKSANDLVKGLENLSVKHARGTDDANKHATATKASGAAMSQAAKASGGHTQSLNQLGSSIAKTILLYTALITATLAAGRAMAHSFSTALTNIDDFRRQAIGTSIAITNLSDPIQNVGQTFEQIFNKNLKATTATFIELETISRRYFASAADLQLAYNQFAQRGIVLGRANLEQLAQLTTQILLLTGGQNSAIQVQEEIRDLITGTLRPTAQLAQQIRSFGKDVKDVGSQIRALQNLDPLKEFLVGTQAATKAIQGTLTPAINGILTTMRQIGRVGFENLFDAVVNGIKEVTNFLQQNKEIIAGTLAVIGRVIGDVVKEASAFTKELFASNKAAGDGTSQFIEFVAILEVFALALTRVTELIVLLIRDLPKAIAAFREAFNEENAQKAVTTVDKMRQAFIDLAKASPFGKVIEQILKLKNVSADTKEALVAMIPGGSFFKQSLDALENVAEVIKKDFEAIHIEDFSGAFERFKQGLIKARAEASKNAKNLGGASPDETAATRIPFKATPEQISSLKQLNDNLTSAEDRLARARRTAQQLVVRADIDIDLQGLQRDLTLLEQGFKLNNRAVVGLRSALNDLNVFIGSNLDATVFGASADFTKLMETVRSTVQGISTDIFRKVNEAASRATEGIETFKKVAQDTSEELRKTEVTPHLERADEIRDEALHQFDVIAEAAAEAVELAQVDLAQAFEKGTERVKDVAIAKLIKAKENQISALDFATLQRDFKLQAETVEREIAAVNNLKIGEQEIGLVAAENKRIYQQQLQVFQAMQTEAGKLFQQTRAAQNAVIQFQETTQRTRPRTDLEIAGGAIQEQRSKFTFDIAQAQGRLAALVTQLDVVSLHGETWDSTLGQTTLAIGKAISEERGRIKVLVESSDAAIANAEHIRAFTTSWNAVTNAVSNSVNVLTDSLLAAFEGKRTDFLSAFKSVTDQLFKDSMKNVFQTLEKQARDGFESVFKKLNISDSMAKTLGPAFLAGFALIASFVLGQLLGGNKNSASAANPQIGVQSSEQVRGLVGGQTQIPIGLVGESLQNALVPTNFLLQRIASGVERLGGGAISAASIENVISQSVSDSLQIQ